MPILMIKVSHLIVKCLIGNVLKKREIGYQLVFLDSSGVDEVHESTPGKSSCGVSSLQKRPEGSAMSRSTPPHFRRYFKEFLFL